MKNLEHMGGTIKVTESDIMAVERDKLILSKSVSIPNTSTKKEKLEKQQIEFGACLWISSTSPNPLISQLQTKSPSKYVSFFRSFTFLNKNYKVTKMQF